jgi:hypothetical protein
LSAQARIAGEREPEEGKQPCARHDRDPGGQQTSLVEQDRADRIGLELVVDLHVPCVGAEDHQECVDHDQRDRHQQHELRVLGSSDERINEGALERVAEGEERGRHRHDCKERIEPERGEQHHRSVHGDGHHLAVGEVHHPHDAENDRQPERHQAVDEAGEQPRDDDVGDQVGRHDEEEPARADPPRGPSLATP